MNKEFEKIIFDLVDFKFDKEINYTVYDGVLVEYDGNKAVIGYNNKPSLTRGLFLFAKEISKGNTNFTIKQKKHFKECGVMLDCSRNAVMTVKSVKKYIEHMAALGLNLLMLYTEDTYEIKEYSYFGYLRGRYTKDEIKEIDLYAQKFGIEVVPCIQTLAHLFQFLKWKNPIEISDTDDILLIDEEKTYEFIECAIKSIKNMFSSNRIHIGMDEAHQVGLGKFLDKNGYQNRFDILNRHLEKVVEICKKYDFKPMMWSDMFFRLASPTHNYYDDTPIPKKVIDAIPEVDMVYWDYYKTNEEAYLKQIQRHKALSKPVIFAGGISTWYGHLPDFDYTLDTTKAALSACAKEGVDTVFATQWGDDGNECNHFLALSLLPSYSEYFYLGENCSEDHIKDASEYLTKQPFEASRDMGFLDNRKNGIRSKGKSFIYGDILYELGVEYSQCKEMNERYKKLSSSMKAMMDKNDKNKLKYEYAYYVYKICEIKSDLRLNLQKKYKEKDKSYLKHLTDNVLPDLKEKYVKLKRLHKDLWFSTYKPFGFEVLSLRYGGVISRIDDTIETVSSYLEGIIPTILELDEVHLDTLNHKSEQMLTPTFFRWA